MRTCLNCGHECAESARFCESCGAEIGQSKKQPVAPDQVLRDPSARPTPSTSSTSRFPWGAVIVIAVFVLVAIGFARSRHEVSPRRAVTSSGTTSSRTYTPRTYAKRYAHSPVNVRSGRGTSHEIVGQIARGVPVDVDSLQDGWYACYRAGRKWGYAYAELLHRSPPPDIEIVSWNWRKDRSFGSKGAIIWTVELRNNTNQYIRHKRVQITTYDSAGNVMDSDWTYVSGLSPGSVSSAKSYATYYGQEQTARIQVLPD